MRTVNICTLYSLTCYICIFVRVLCKLDCDACTDSIKSTSQPKDSLITLRDYGNYLFYPTNFVIHLLSTAEKALSTELKKNCLSKSFIFDKIVIQIVSDFFNLNRNVKNSWTNMLISYVKIFFPSTASLDLNIMQNL